MPSQPTAGIPSKTTDPASRKIGVRAVHLLNCLFVLAALLALGACNSPFSPRLTATPTAPTATPAPPTATPEPMAAMVNGDGITVAEFQAQVAQYKAAQTSLGKTVSDEDASKAVLEDLIAQLLLAQGARAAGFELDGLRPAIEGGCAAKRRSAARTSCQSGRPITATTPASFLVALKRSAEAAWMRDKIVTAVPKTADQVHVQQILLYNEGDANAVLEQLKIGGDFNALAAQYDPNTRGDLGWFPKGYSARTRRSKRPPSPCRSASTAT